jgi:hypothetical protein
MIPQVGDTITRRHGEKLCRQFGLYREANRIAAHPEHYRQWEFDGCSGVPDGLFSRLRLMGWQWQKITLACLIHDLRYAYGIPGDKEARLSADRELRTALLGVIPPWAAAVFYHTVRAGGGEWTWFSFRWAFAVV